MDPFIDASLKRNSSKKEKSSRQRLRGLPCGRVVCGLHDSIFCDHFSVSSFASRHPFVTPLSHSFDFLSSNLTPIILRSILRCAVKRIAMPEGCTG
ncbi:hypothetical protein QR680_013811 [Steinernema hermaphroditum]|uniref:Uncharacterized protein n=1 Tax=Steinernema hermaphroditum TaxID=289476 RepID=A0AA39I8U9_9BILA|nr:hypothetical protein QR680_013811 [Steinernema hermaphroditum]